VARVRYEEVMFIIEGLDPTPFQPLFALSDAELAERDIRRRFSDDVPGFPCRISLQDAPVGEELLLLPYRHRDVRSPYRSEGPIFVRRGVPRARFVDELPPMLASRVLSLLGFDRDGMLVTADVVPGPEAYAAVLRQLKAAELAYIDVMLARTGCFACRIVPGL